MSLGWNFDMGFVKQGILNNTNISNPIHKKVVDEISLKFPNSGDCIANDVSIKNAQDFNYKMLTEKAGNNFQANVEMRPYRKGDSYEYNNKYNQAIRDRVTYVNKMLEILPIYIVELKTNFNNNNCTDYLEQQKAQANAQILTKEAIKSEKQVLEKNYKEQYLYIGVGSVILLVGLYIVTRNKK